MGPDNYATLAGLKFAEGFKFVQVTPHVIEIAADIRDQFLKHPLPGAAGMTVGMGDAIHVASAIARDADVLVTTDERNKTQKKELGLLKLPHQITPDYFMHIRRPIPPPQMDFDLDEQSEQTA